MQPEHELVPYAPGSLPGDPILVLAPHPDDEVIGCGGFLAQAVDEGREIHVMILTDGAAQGHPQARRAESLEAARRLGLPEPMFVGLQDRGLAHNLPELIGAIRHALERTGPRLLLLPSPAEVHPDHRAVALATYHLLSNPEVRARDELELVAYEVSAVLRPNLLLDVGAVWDRVSHAVEAFASQLEVHPYMKTLEAIATARCLTLGRSVERTEAFFGVSLAFVRSHTAAEWASRQGPSSFLEGSEYEISDQRRILEQLRRRISSLEERVAACKARLEERDELERLLTESEGRLRELDETLAAVRRSWTWKIHSVFERLKRR